MMECGSVDQPRFGCITAHDPFLFQLSRDDQRCALHQRPPPLTGGWFILVRNFGSKRNATCSSTVPHLLNSNSAASASSPSPTPPPPPPPAAAPPHGTILLPSTSTTANTWPAVPMAAAPFTTSSLRLITAPLKRFRLVPNVARPPPSHRHRHPCSRLGRLPILRRKGVLLPSAHGHFQLVPAPRDY